MKDSLEMNPFLMERNDVKYRAGLKSLHEAV